MLGPRGARRDHLDRRQHRGVGPPRGQHPHVSLPQHGGDGPLWCRHCIWGFFGNPDNELYVRRLPALLPVPRPHRHKEAGAVAVQRREDVPDQGPGEVPLHAATLPLWYTLFYETEQEGAPHEAALIPVPRELSHSSAHPADGDLPGQAGEVAQYSSYSRWQGCPASSWTKPSTSWRCLPTFSPTRSRTLKSP